MAASDTEEIKNVLTRIEDGELDDYLVNLQEAIDERNARRKKALIRQIKGVWGEDAEIVVGSRGEVVGVQDDDGKVLGAVQQTDAAVAQAAIAPRADYVPDTGPQIPKGAPDAAGQDWGTPVVSAAFGDFSPVPDPMAAGPGE